MGRTACKLKKIDVDKGVVRIVFKAIHESDETTLSQELVLVKDCGLWTAGIQMDDFPQMPTAGAAVEKLADWLERMALAIRSRDYESILIADIGSYGEGRK